MIWIGYSLVDRLITYPRVRNLSACELSVVVDMTMARLG